MMPAGCRAFHIALHGHGYQSRLQQERALRAAIGNRSINDRLKSLTIPIDRQRSVLHGCQSDNSSGTFGTRFVRLTACEAIFAGRQLDRASTQSMMMLHQ